MSAFNGYNGYRGKQEGSKAKRYWIIGIVLAVLTALLLIWNSGIFIKNATAATVGETTYTVAEVDYYYYGLLNQTINTAKSYAQYGMDAGYNPSVSPRDQYYDEENGVTFADYFQETALTQLQQVTILSEQAKAEGYTLSDKGKASIDSTMNQISMYAAENGYSVEAYLKNLSGSYMTKSLYLSILEKSTLASEYAEHKQSQFKYTDENLNTYYQNNAANLDSYEYRFCHIDAETKTAADAEGKEVEPTDAEKTAAMDAAKKSADAMASRVKNGTAFNTAAKDYVADTAKESYSDPEYNHSTDVLGSDLSSYAFSSWMKEAGRRSGEVTVVQDGESGYFVVQFLSRKQANDSYQTVDYRNILILAETTAAQNSESNAQAGDAAAQNSKSPALPTNEQLASAKSKAEEILAQWQSSGATADSFAALAKQYSQDEKSKTVDGLYKDAMRGSLNSATNGWLFTPGRAVGTAEIVEYTDENGTVTGYQILFLDKLGQVRWKYQAQSALSSADYEKWYSSLEEQYPANATDAMQKVGA